jgi:RHS repeat-associated protein
MTDVEGTHNYTYDNVYRLTQAQHPAGTSLPVVTETFSYDAIGNRLADTTITGYTYNAGNELTSNSSFTYTYDADGNQVTKTDTSSNETTLSFDSQGELTSVELPSSVNWTYQYDAKMRRVSKSSGSAESQGVQYVYDGRNTLAVLDNSNSLISVFTNNPSSNELLLMHAGGGTDYVYSTDALGSIRMITDSSGNPIESYKYEAYGQTLIQNSSGDDLSVSAIDNVRMYLGLEFDAESGHDYFHARYYDPAPGEFISTDPSGIRSGINAYAYAGENPLNDEDPLGMDWQTTLGGVGTAVGGYAGGTIGGTAAAGGSVLLDLGSGGANIPATPAEVGAGIGLGAAGGAVLGGSLGSNLGKAIDQMCAANNQSNSNQMTCVYLGKKIFGLCVYGCWDANGNTLGEFPFAPNEDGSCPGVKTGIPIPPQGS